MSTPSPDPDIDMLDAPNETDEEHLFALHAQAQHTYKIKTSKLPGRPRLEVLYLHRECALFPRAPHNLQITVYLSMYNRIAAAAFVAQKHLAWDVCEVIWYYGGDEGHTFDWRKNSTHWNIVLMCFVWASGFDAAFCRPGCEEFVKGFIMVSWPEVPCRWSWRPIAF